MGKVLKKLASIGKIEDLMFRANGLVPKEVCNYFIDVLENNLEDTRLEFSYKYDTKKRTYDNYTSLNISELSNKNKYYVEPRDIARKFLGIMITNYVLHIQRTICPSFLLNLLMPQIILEF